MYYNWHIKRLFQSSYLPGLIPKVTHVHEYKEGVDDFSVFDISACYVQPKQVERVVFSLPGIVISLGYFPGKVHYSIVRKHHTIPKYFHMKKIYENPCMHICTYERMHEHACMYVHT